MPVQNFLLLWVKWHFKISNYICIYNVFYFGRVFKDCRVLQRLPLKRLYTWHKRNIWSTYTLREEETEGDRMVTEI